MKPDEYMARGRVHTGVADMLDRATSDEQTMDRLIWVRKTQRLTVPPA